MRKVHRSTDRINREFNSHYFLMSTNAHSTGIDIANAVEGKTSPGLTTHGNWATALSLGMIASRLLWLGSYPGPTIELVRTVVKDLAEGTLHAKFQENQNR